MRMYEFITGDVVRVYADNEEEAREKLASGYYDFVETHSEITYVGSEVHA